MPAPQRDLGNGELEVLKVLWDLGPCTVRDVREEMRRRRRQLAYNTVQTVLRRLHEKEFVVRDDREASHVFRARVSRDAFGRRRLRELMRGVYDGAAGAVVLQLVRHGRLAPDEIAELQALLEQQLSQAGRKPSIGSGPGRGARRRR
ncbi:MAG: BlaI/MecI/CopY family transcriptional regulator [Planctomycetota bacterium]